MANLLEKLFTSGANIIGARNQERAVKRDKQDQLNLIKSLDWTPTTTAELAPAYQRSQSPVARSYLESFLLGNNPDAVMPGDPMAEQKKRQMQYSQNQMFGTPEQRVAQQNAYRATTPWAIGGQPGAQGAPSGGNAIARAQRRQEASQKAGMHAAEHPRAVDAGLDADTFAALEKHGLVKGNNRLNDLAKKHPDVIKSLADNGAWTDLEYIMKLPNLDEISRVGEVRGPVYQEKVADWSLRHERAKKIIAAERKRLDDIAKAGA